MQPRLPVHPSLPTNPQLYGHPNYYYANPHTPSPNIGTMAARALTFSLANPYGNASHTSYTNTNYHAYFTQMQQPATTAQGYTLSSTYVPQVAGPSGQADSQLWSQVQRGRSSNHRCVGYAPHSFGRNNFSAPGDTRCRHEGCIFTGSTKAVEIHMMDRHLIFPVGWKKKRDDWDTDPSLKGSVSRSSLDNAHQIPSSGSLCPYQAPVSHWTLLKLSMCGSRNAGRSGLRTTSSMKKSARRKRPPKEEKSTQKS